MSTDTSTSVLSRLRRRRPEHLLVRRAIFAVLLLAGACVGLRDWPAVLGSSWAMQTALLAAALALSIAELAIWTIRTRSRQTTEHVGRLERLALVAEITTNAVMITDARKNIVWVNEAFSRMTGFDANEARGRRPGQLLRHPLADQRTVTRVRAAIERGEGVRAQYLNRRKDGEDLWLDLDIQPLRDHRQALTGLIVVASDITERRRALADQRVAAIAFDSLEAIAITDANQIILKVNPAFTRITGYTAEEAIGRVTGRLLSSGRHEVEFYVAMWKALKQDKHWQGEVWNRRKNGEIYPEWLSITAVTDEDGHVANYVAVFSDITQKKQADETIHSLAFYDPLTELPNRRLLRDRLTQVVAAAARHHRPAAVLFMDLDHFKELNDTKGHDTGDQLLVEVARRLQDTVRSNDTVARQGGDEFVIILTELSAATERAAVEAEIIAEKIRSAINRPFHLDGFDWHGTLSIGISLLLDGDAAVDDLLKRADTAMYEAKKSGRNAIRFFDPATHAAMEERIAIEADLRRALAGEQLTLYYQMQVDRTGRAFGAEVLLRWAHPTRGLIAPGLFIPIAEASDLILPIGQWVLETACDQLRAWAEHASTAHLQLAVNVSARQFRQADFVEQVRSALTKMGASPGLLKLELTESLVLVNLSETVAKMQAIRDMGVRFSIDDFGTGHSSLAYLTRLPMDQLKIDQSFVRNMLGSHTDAVIVQTIVGMANSLDLEVIAEGVETEEQRIFLEGCGCLCFQGYLFGRPAPIREFEALLSARHAKLTVADKVDASVDT